jgi:hypothetical protein
MFLARAAGCASDDRVDPLGPQLEFMGCRVPVHFCRGCAERYLTEFVARRDAERVVTAND